MGGVVSPPSPLIRFHCSRSNCQFNRTLNTALSARLVYCLARSRHFVGFDIVRRCSERWRSMVRRQGAGTRSRNTGFRNAGLGLRGQHQDEEATILTEPLVSRPRRPNQNPTTGRYADPSVYLPLAPLGDETGYKTPQPRDGVPTYLVSPSPTLVGHQDSIPDENSQSSAHHPIYSQFSSLARDREASNVSGSSTLSPSPPHTPHPGI
jgi:hypothetical protein